MSDVDSGLDYDTEDDGFEKDSVVQEFVKRKAKSKQKIRTVEVVYRMTWFTKDEIEENYRANDERPLRTVSERIRPDTGNVEFLCDWPTRTVPIRMVPKRLVRDHRSRRARGECVTCKRSHMYRAQAQAYEDRMIRCGSRGCNVHIHDFCKTDKGPFVCETHVSDLTDEEVLSELLSRMAKSSLQEAERALAASKAVMSTHANIRNLLSVVHETAPEHPKEPSSSSKDQEIQQPEEQWNTFRYNVNEIRDALAEYPSSCQESCSSKEKLMFPLIATLIEGERNPVCLACASKSEKGITAFVCKRHGKHCCLCGETSCTKSKDIVPKEAVALANNACVTCLRSVLLGGVRLAWFERIRFLFPLHHVIVSPVGEKKTFESNKRRYECHGGAEVELKTDSESVMTFTFRPENIDDCSTFASKVATFRANMVSKLLSRDLDRSYLFKDAILQKG